MHGHFCVQFKSINIKLRPEYFCVILQLFIFIMIAKFPSVPKNKLNLLIVNAHTVILTTSVMNIRIEETAKGP